MQNPKPFGTSNTTIWPWSPCQVAARVVCICFSLSLSVSGCGSTMPPRGALYDRLRDRGPVVLSTTNPYLPANRLLSEELQSDPTLRDFLADRGSPTALAVEQGMLERTSLSLFYPDEHEVYRLVRSQSGWQVGAPVELDDDTAARLEKELALGGVTLGGNQKKGKYVAALISEPSASSLVTNEDGEGRARLAPGNGSTESWPAWPGQSATPRKAATTTSISKESAPLRAGKRGSLVHTVTFPGESLSLLALWFTGSASYVPELAKASGLNARQPLRLGVDVIIPGKLVKNRKPLTFKQVRAR